MWKEEVPKDLQVLDIDVDLVSNKLNNEKRYRGDPIILRLGLFYYFLYSIFLPKLLSSFYYVDPIAQDYITRPGGENEVEGLTGVNGRFVPSKKVLELRKKLIKFMEDHIYPLENEFYKLSQSSSRWTVHPEEERLKELAKKEGLWNLWIPVFF